MRSTCHGHGSRFPDRKACRLTPEQQDTFLAYLLFKQNDQALDLRRLIPQGSIIVRAARHFRATDITYVTLHMRIEGDALPSTGQN